jgi:hypothetical protein
MLGVSMSLFLLSCKGIKAVRNENESDAKIRYFVGYAPKMFPIVPFGEISESNALSREAYGVAYYDELGQLRKFQSFRDKKLLHTHEYEYHDNKKVKSFKFTNVYGRTIHITYYDRNGRQLRREEEELKGSGEN